MSLVVSPPGSSDEEVRRVPAVEAEGQTANNRIVQIRVKDGRAILRRFQLVSDLCLVWISAAAVLLVPAYVRYAAADALDLLFLRGIAGFLLFFSVLIVLFGHVHGLYEVPWKKGLRSDLSLLAKSVLCAGLTSGAGIYLLYVPALSADSVALAAVASWISLAAWRTFIRSQSISGLTAVKNILIVGCGRNGEQLRRHLERNPDLGYFFKGYIDRRKNGRLPNAARNREEADILGPAEQLPAIARTHFIDEVLITVPGDQSLVKEIASHARVAGISVRVVPDSYDGLANPQAVEYVGNFPTMTLNEAAIPTAQLIVKRFVDIVVSASLLFLSIPFFIALAAIIKLDSKGPILYRSLRVGKKGKTFLCWKFRTMVADADALRKQLQHLNERDGILFKISADPRITRVGKILRKFSLDELPQLWNVLKQDMSLVGPRPCMPTEYRQYALEHLRRLDVTPGMTGLWQVTSRRNPSFEDYILQDKEYVNNWSLALDCKILLKTIGVVVSGTGQ